MIDIHKVDLSISCVDVERIEVAPFQVGIWRFSDADDLDDLSHLEELAITRPLIERYGRSVLSIDLSEDNYTDHNYQRLKWIYEAIPNHYTRIRRLCSDGSSPSKAAINSVHIYGDDIAAVINQLVTMQTISGEDGLILSQALKESMELDNPNAAAARTGAAERVWPAPEAKTMDHL